MTYRSRPDFRGQAVIKVTASRHAVVAPTGLMLNKLDEDRSCLAKNA